jgi:DNA topoisomerase VI subunit B
VNDLESSLRGQMKKMGSDLESKVEKMERELESRLRKAATDAGESAVEHALRDLKILQFEQLKREARDWETKGVDANALTTYARCLPLANEIAPEYEVPNVLDEILRVLGKKNALMSAITAAEMNKAIGRVSKDYSGTVAQIRQGIAYLAETPKSERS